MFDITTQFTCLKPHQKAVFHFQTNKIPQQNFLSQASQSSRFSISSFNYPFNNVCNEALHKKGSVNYYSSNQKLKFPNLAQVPLIRQFTKSNCRAEQRKFQMVFQRNFHYIQKKEFDKIVEDFLWVREVILLKDYSV